MKKIFKNIAIVLILFALSSFFSSCQNVNKEYNNAIKTRFQQVQEELIARLNNNVGYDVYQNQDITHIRFTESENDEIYFQVFYKGDYESDLGIDTTVGIVYYKIQLEYYEALINAQATGNVLYYLDTMQDIFENMNYVRGKIKNPIECKLINDTEENRVKFNEIFNVSDIENDDIVRQVGFLPYYVKVENYTYDNKTFKHEYTYKISGISFCETITENKDKIIQNGNLILESNYDKNHIKTYYRDVLFTSSTIYDGEINLTTCLSWNILYIIENRNNPYTVETTFFKEYDLLKIYDQIKEGNINFKKPKDFNVQEYLENIN